MAETISPSVRGALRIQVLLLLAGAGGLTGALVGLATGAAWDGLDLPRPSDAAVVVVTVGAALLEIVGWPRPLAVRRQVPQLWGRLFGPRTVAVLYGARLGVGPLTVLPTWWWWAAFGLGAASGPWPSAAAGATFGVARALFSTLATSGVHDGGGMLRRSARLWSLERRVTRLVAVAAVALALAACSSGDDDTPALELEPSSTTTPEDTALAELLLTDSLPGFERADEALNAGPLDLDAAAAAESDTEAEQALLETRRFERGVSRGWLDSDGDVAYIVVYDFADQAGAEGYLADGTETLIGRAATPFDVPGIPGAQGFTTVEIDDSDTFTAHAVAFTSGNRWCLVLVGSNVASRTIDDARQLAEAQAALLS